MPIGGEGPGLHQDAPTPALRAIEARQHQVQVHRERVHGDDLTGPGTTEHREPRSHVLVIRHPRPAPVLVRLHGPLRPLLELLVHELPGRERQEPQRVAAQIHEGLTARIPRQRKA